MQNKNTAETWRKSSVHERLEHEYRSEENIRFYQMALQSVIDEFGLQGELHWLDAGCGSGTKTLLLAEQGYRVTGVDVSPRALERAEAKAEQDGKTDRIQFHNESLLSLPFEDDCFDCVICWGVLMHVPQVEEALRELVRVLKPGGYFIISESHFRSLQARITRLIKSLLRRGKQRFEHKPAGIECWVETEAGIHLTRQADPKWMKQYLEQNSCVVKWHRAGEFTEWYIQAPSRWMKRLIHGWNKFWFQNIKNPYLAFGNLYVFQKRSVSTDKIIT